MSSSSNAFDPTGLQTEFFQLVQTALYHADGMWGDATVDLYLKQMPSNRGYVVAAGIAEAIDAVQNLRFSDDDLEWIRSMPLYERLGSTFFESLRHFSFSGSILAVPDGTPIFAKAPFLRITAPLPQIGLFEMLLTQKISCASAVATNASRLTQAAQGKAVLDFGTRRVPGRDLSQLAARAAYIGGTSGTTHALAARTTGIPVVGLISDTMLAAYEDVALAYDALSSHFPDGCHLNLPTEAPLDGIERFERIHDKVQTVRIDHPDLDALSRAVRQRLDERGMSHTRILGSGALDANRIDALVRQQAPIDVFAVGSALTEGITGDGPQLCYRMAALIRGTSPVPIRGHWSSHWPSVKQVFRYPEFDLVCSEVESTEQLANGGTPILVPWVVNGERVHATQTLGQQRAHCERTLSALPLGVRRLVSPDTVPVRASDTLTNMRD